jgi:hypothetical protein
MMQVAQKSVSVWIAVLSFDWITRLSPLPILLHRRHEEMPDGRFHHKTNIILFVQIVDIATPPDIELTFSVLLFRAWISD